MHLSRAIVLQLVTLLLASCILSPQKVPAPQGNIVEAKNVAQLKPGMNKSQVRFLLGTPMIQDPFHPNRWDYFSNADLNEKASPTKRVTLYFDGENLAKIETIGDLNAKLGEPASEN